MTMFTELEKQACISEKIVNLRSGSMGKDWVRDINYMHKHYGTDEAMQKMDPEKLKQFLKFRIDFLQEELDELRAAKGAEDVVDALIDLCVVAIGTLDSFDVDAYKAWDEVLEANMNKRVEIGRAHV